MQMEHVVFGLRARNVEMERERAVEVPSNALS
jgi:hypothetical protein